MATQSLAVTWLRENDLSQSAWKRRTVNKRRAAKSKARKFVAYNEWDEKALKRLEQSEARFRGLRHAHGYESYSDAVRHFIKKSHAFDAPECLLLPMFDIGTAISPSPGLPAVSPARMMLMRHEMPSSDDLVCRHKCGNGHMGCVNPKHLVWGTALQNSADLILHATRPATWPDITKKQIDAILESDMPHNVVAVDMNIPAAIVAVIRKRNA